MVRCIDFRLVTTDATISILNPFRSIDEPIGFDSLKISLKRDMDTFGFTGEGSDGEIDLEFDCPAGKALIEEIYNAKGQDGGNHTTVW
jgi:hypothetical protein